MIVIMQMRWTSSVYKTPSQGCRYLEVFSPPPLAVYHSPLGAICLQPALLISCTVYSKYIYCSNLRGEPAIAVMGALAPGAITAFYPSIQIHLPQPSWELPSPPCWSSAKAYPWEKWVEVFSGQLMSCLDWAPGGLLALLIECLLMFFFCIFPPIS